MTIDPLYTANSNRLWQFYDFLIQLNKTKHLNYWVIENKFNRKITNNKIMYKTITEKPQDFSSQLINNYNSILIEGLQTSLSQSS